MCEDHKLPNVYEFITNKTARSSMKLKIERPNLDIWKQRMTLVLSTAYGASAKLVNGYVHWGQSTGQASKSKHLFTILPDGSIKRGPLSHNPRRLPPEDKKLIWEELKKLEDDCLEYSKDYGKRTGVCLVCGAVLTDPVSVAWGIGPVCAEKFGINRDRSDGQKNFSLDDFI